MGEERCVHDYEYLNDRADLLSKQLHGTSEKVAKEPDWLTLCRSVSPGLGSTATLKANHKILVST